ncbi:MAG: helix-turn-helix domain-containing protein [Deltaproteobacteria bacterium]|nr:helix-turn-helix domain-containing protein [Kofleriaceae bacterium]
MPALDPDATLRLVGRRVAQHRHRRGWTQEVLAERLGLSTKYLQRVEWGRQNLSLRSLATIASALGCRPFDLLRPMRSIVPVRPGRPRASKRSTTRR